MISSSLSDERLSAGEPVDQVEGPLGLVVGDHVPRVSHLQKYSDDCFWVKNSLNRNTRKKKPT